MMRRPLQAIVMTGLISSLMLILASPAAAHSGEGVSLEHVIIELATWTLGVIAVIAVIVAVFWLRARVSRR